MPHRARIHTATAALVVASVVVATVTPALGTAPAPESGVTLRAATGAVRAGLASDTAAIDLGPGPVAIGLDGATPMVVIEDAPADASFAVRSRTDGRWSEWILVTAEADEAPDAAPTTGPVGIGPIWVGHGADSVQVDPIGDGPARLEVTGLAPIAPPKRSWATATATSSTTSSTSSTTSTTTTTTTPATTTTTTAAPPAAGTVDPPPGPVTYHRRSDWATADMGWACSSGPSESDGVRAAVVHHTAGTNDYRPEDVPAIIRGIWRFHVDSRGWCDIGYNFVADAYGGVWEARQGGASKAIIGGHTRGFNTDTTGIAQLGNHESSPTPAAANHGVDWLLGWKLSVHGIDPAGRTTVTNRTGSEFRGVPDGGEVDTATVVGHRDLGSTSCPGRYTYADLIERRSAAALGIHVTALYETFLQAFPTLRQYGTWFDLASAEGLGAAATGMAYSETYAGLVVDDLYRRVLGRPAEAAGRGYWLEQLAAGMRVEDMGVLFYGSQEYRDRAGSLSTWVTWLYENLLHREPEDDGLAFWIRSVETGAMTEPEVARGFYQSVESRRDRVARLYETILGRRPDRSGWAHWTELLIDTDDVLLAVELAVSDEFYERALR